MSSQQVDRRKSPWIFYGWVVVGISLLTMTIAYAVRYSFSVFYPAILDEFGWSRAETALGFSINMVVYAAFSPIVGTLIDRFGPRRVLPVGGAICGLGLFGLSQLNAIWQMYLFFAVLATGIGLTGYVAHIAFISNWFSLKLGTALGIAVAGMALGNLSSMPVQALIQSVGWRGAYMVFAIIPVAVIVPMTIAFQRHRAADMGLPLDGMAEPRDGQEASKTEGSQPDIEAQRVIDEKWVSTDWTLNKSLKTTKFWLFFLQSSASGMCVNMVLVHTVAYLVDAGHSEMFAASIFATVGGFALVSPIGGFISDRLGRELAYTLLSSSMILGIVFLMVSSYAQAFWIPWVFVVLYGIGQGGDRPIAMSAKADLFKGKHLGVIVGTNNLGYGLGGAIGPWLGGYIFDVTGSYTLAYSTAIGLLVASTSFLWAAAPRKVRVVGGKIRRELISAQQIESNSDGS